MKIASADIYDIKLYENIHSYNLAFLRLNTDEGIEGIGEVALAYGSGATAAVGQLKQLAERFLIGADPFRIEAMWHTLFRRTFWGQGGGPVIYGAMSAIDAALWDIKGKALGVPAYELLGGKVNDKLRVYANGWYGFMSDSGRDYYNAPEEYAEAAQRVVADGFTALKFDPFTVLPDGSRSAPERLISKERGDLAYARVEAVREAVGPDVDILIEVHGNLGTTAAIEMGRRFEALDPFFYEEPVDAMNVDAMLKVSQNVNIPIAAGERLYTRYGFREYIEKQVLDILQPDMGLAGGLTEVKKIAAHAETYDMHIQPHNCAGPISTAVAVQLDTCITNFVIQEWFPYRDNCFTDLVEQALDTQAVNGYYTVTDAPGIGLLLNQDALARYPVIHVA